LQKKRETNSNSVRKVSTIRSEHLKAGRQQPIKQTSRKIQQQLQNKRKRKIQGKLKTKKQVIKPTKQ